MGIMWQNANAACQTSWGSCSTSGPTFDCASSFTMNGIRYCCCNPTGLFCSSSSDCTGSGSAPSSTSGILSVYVQRATNLPDTDWWPHGTIDSKVKLQIASDESFTSPSTCGQTATVWDDENPYYNTWLECDSCIPGSYYARLVLADDDSESTWARNKAMYLDGPSVSWTSGTFAGTTLYYTGTFDTDSCKSLPPPFPSPPPPHSISCETARHKCEHITCAGKDVLKNECFSANIDTDGIKMDGTRASCQCASTSSTLTPTSTSTDSPSLECKQTVCGCTCETQGVGWESCFTDAEVENHIEGELGGCSHLHDQIGGCSNAPDYIRDFFLDATRVSCRDADSSSSNNLPLIVGAGVGGAVAIILAIVITVMVLKKKKKEMLEAKQVAMVSTTVPQMDVSSKTDNMETAAV